LSVQERVDLLAGLELADDRAPQHVAEWLRRLVIMRNRLAHAWVVEATQSRAEFSSIYRGRLTKLIVFDEEMARAFRMVRESERSLRYLADVVGDPHLWGRLMGFDEH
jgi:hypothetical protein